MSNFNFVQKIRQSAKRSLLFLAAVFMLSFGVSAPVFARIPCSKNLTALDCASILGPWPAWDTNTGNTCGSATDGPSTLTGSDNIQKIFNYFVSHGIPAAGAAGIMGNMSRESGFDPTAEQTAGGWEDLSQGYGSGVGLVQWDGGRRVAVITYLKSKGLSDADFHKPSDKLLSTELDYVMKELTESYPTTLQALKTISDPQLTALTFHQEYEGSSDGPGQIQNRMTMAQEIYDKYGKGGATGGGTTGAPGSSAIPCSGNNSPYTIDGNFVAYEQCDPRWANTPFSGSNICGSGCGPTSMAMIISTLTGQPITPNLTAAYAMSNGDATATDVFNKIAPDLAAHWGLKATALNTTDVAKINAVLQAGGLVFAGGKGSLPFTSEGHYIVIRGVTTDGKWLLGDPAAPGPGRSNTTPFDPQAIISAGMDPSATFAITK